MTTKKVKSTGRFGSRYGVGIRKRLLKVDDRQKELSACPFCGFKKVKRKAAGLFKCNKCGAKFAGGAYVTETLAGKTIKKIVNQKSFNNEEIIPEKKTSYSEIEDEVAESVN
jgi:large subunit ribosomal protein L37Ae